ncbi:FACT complex subunit SPT16-like protein [Tanacetum coccineum]
MDTSYRPIHTDNEQPLNSSSSSVSGSTTSNSPGTRSKLVEQGGGPSDDNDDLPASAEPVTPAQALAPAQEPPREIVLVTFRDDKICGLVLLVKMAADRVAYKIDESTMARPLQSLYSHWGKHRDELWGSCNVFAVATPPPSNDIRYLKSSALHLYPNGYHISRHLIIWKWQFYIVFGHIAKETQSPEGKFEEKWVEKLTSSRLQLNDLTNGLAHLFVVKEDNELTNYISHSSLMDATEKVILDPAKVKVKLKATNCDICYPSIFQSSVKFDLRPKASSNDDNLYYDSGSVIICALGSRYKSYCANVARTILIDTDATQTKSYQVLRKAHEAAIGAIQPGNN